MNLSETAKVIYNNAKEILITKDIHNNEIFTQNWLKNTTNNNLKNLAGWYWIKTDLELNLLTKLEPQNQREKGSVFNITTQNNQNIFDKDLINKTYFYNGHAKNIVSRLRNHFYLQNDKTGALGINAYPILKNHTITVGFFTIDMIEAIEVSEVDKLTIEKLIKENIGRTAIENAWRAENGFPILCKH